MKPKFGLFYSAWGCDFTFLHENSHSTKEDKERLRRYGAFFSKAGRQGRQVKLRM